MKRTIVISFYLIASILTYSQQEVNLLDLAGNCCTEKRNAWYFSEFGKKVKPVKKLGKNVGLEFLCRDSSTTLRIDRTGQSIELLSSFGNTREIREIFNVSFDFKFSDTCAAKALSFACRNDLVDRKLFSLTLPFLDTMEIEKWYRIEFSFGTVPWTTNESKFVIKYLNPYQGRGHVELRDFRLEMKRDKSTQNLVRNGSFEDYYYFPVGYDVFFPNSLMYWNDFDNNFRSLNSNVNVSVNSNFKLFNSVNIVSDYHPLYSKKINIYDGHFSAEILNEYVYDSLPVPYDELRNANYFQTELKKELLRGEKYILKFAIMLSPESFKADNSFGVKFSDSLYNPLDEVDLFARNRPLPSADLLFFEEPILNDSSWTTVEALYTASGGEKFLCFGVFKNVKHIQRLASQKNHSRKNYHSSYLIDSVELVSANP